MTKACTDSCPRIESRSFPLTCVPRRMNALGRAIAPALDPSCNYDSIGKTLDHFCVRGLLLEEGEVAGGGDAEPREDSQAAKS